MKRKKTTSDTVVGLFVILGIIAVNLVTFVIRDDIFGGTTKIKVTFNTVSGLEVGSPVLVSGINGGRVGSIRYVPEDKRPNVKSRNGEILDAQPVVVTMVVRSKFPVYDNARVRLVQQGFIGDKRVEIDPGTPDGGAKLIDNDSPPLRGEPFFDMERVFIQAEQVVDDLQATVASFREFATDDENIATIRKTIENLNRSVEKMHTYLVTNEENVTASVANIREISEDVKEFSERAKIFFAEEGRLDEITGNADATIKDLRGQLNDITTKAEETIDSINKTVVQIDERSARMTDSAVSFMDDTKGDFRALSNNLQETSTNLDAVIRKIKRGEGTVGRLLTDPKPFEDLKDSISTLNSFIAGNEDRFYDTRIEYEMPAASRMKDTPTDE